MLNFSVNFKLFLIIFIPMYFLINLVILPDPVITDVC